MLVLCNTDIYTLNMFTKNCYANLDTNVLNLSIETHKYCVYERATSVQYRINKCFCRGMYPHTLKGMKYSTTAVFNYRPIRFTHIFSKNYRRHWTLEFPIPKRKLKLLRQPRHASLKVNLLIQINIYIDLLDDRRILADLSKDFDLVDQKDLL